MRSFSLGRVHGIDLRLHPSFAVVVAWVLFDWRRLGDGSASSLIFGLALVFAVFGCVLLHELGHAAMASHFGIRVHDVTLSLIGGVARLGRMPASPRAEVAVAAAGPAVNLAIASLLAPWVLVFGALDGFSSPRDYLLGMLSPSAVGFVSALVAANLMLAVFNSIPAFPMDGGRMLRASLAARMGREQGTMAAVAIAVGIGLVLAVAGVAWLGSISLPFVALFVAGAACLEGRAVRIEGALRRLRVAQFALWDRGGIAPDRPLSWALRGGPRDLAVIEGGRVIGMLWRNRLLAEIGAGGGERRVADVMDVDVVTIDAAASVYDAHRLMRDLDRWAVPVTEGDQYRGMFTVDRLTHVYRQVSPRLPGIRRLPALEALLDGLMRALAR